MSWIDASVDEFCRGMGLDAVDFSTAGRVQLSFEQSGTLHIENIMIDFSLCWRVRCRGISRASVFSMRCVCAMPNRVGHLK